MEEEENVPYEFMYFNVDTQEVEVVKTSIPKFIADYIDDIQSIATENIHNYYEEKAYRQLLTHTLLPQHQN